MYTFYKNLSPEIMNLIFKKSTNPYNLRSKNPFISHNVHTVHYGTETIAFRGPKIWAHVPEEIKNSGTSGGDLLGALVDCASFTTSRFFKLSTVFFIAQKLFLIVF